MSCIFLAQSIRLFSNSANDMMSSLDKFLPSLRNALIWIFTSLISASLRSINFE